MSVVPIRREMRISHQTLLTLDRFEYLGEATVLSFYTMDGKMPGFNFCFTPEMWQKFRQFVSEFDPPEG